MKKYTLAQIKKYYASLPKKRVSVGALFLNKENKILLVKPNYKDNWLVVGGTVDAKESPIQAIKREVKEEINLNFKPKLICVEYKLKKSFQGEAVYFLFYGGKLTDAQIKKIKLQESELEDYKFVSPKSAVKILSATAGPKIPHCMKAIKNNEVIYLENSKLIK